MFRFRRELILPFFFQKRMTIYSLAKLAGVSGKTAERAVNGQEISSRSVGKVARAMGIDAFEYLAPPAQMKGAN